MFGDLQEILLNKLSYNSQKTDLSSAGCNEQYPICQTRQCRRVYQEKPVTSPAVPIEFERIRHEVSQSASNTGLRHVCSGEGSLNSLRRGHCLFLWVTTPIVSTP